MHDTHTANFTSHQLRNKRRICRVQSPGWAALSWEVNATEPRSAGMLYELDEGGLCQSQREIEKYCKMTWDWVLSPLKYAAPSICLCTLQGNHPDFDVTMWKYNYTISWETLACHIIFTFGSKQMCTRLSVHLSIYPSIYLSNIFSEWMRSFCTQNTEPLFRVLLLTRCL